MSNSVKDNIKKMFNYDPYDAYKTPYGADYCTLEELVAAHDCTVEEVTALAHPDDHIACVIATMKLSVAKRNETEDTLKLWLLRRETLNMLTYQLFNCEAIELYEKPKVLGNKRYVRIDDEAYLELFKTLGVHIENGNCIHWESFHDCAIDIDCEIMYLHVGLGIEFDEDSEWYDEWEEIKASMIRTQAVQSFLEVL